MYLLTKHVLPERTRLNERYKVCVRDWIIHHPCLHRLHSCSLWPSRWLRQRSSAQCEASPKGWAEREAWPDGKFAQCSGQMFLSLICDPLRQNPEHGSFVTFSTFNIKRTTSNKALKWHQDHVCSINISQDMADFVSGIYNVRIFASLLRNEPVSFPFTTGVNRD